VTNDAADDDLSRSMIFKIWLVSPVANPHNVAEFENEVHCNFRIEQKNFVELLYAGDKWCYWWWFIS